MFRTIGKSWTQTCLDIDLRVYRLLDNAQGDSSQDSRTYKLQEEDFIIGLVRSIERQAQNFN